MTLLLLIRHAENDWVKTGRLAGWTEGVHLNEEGQRQAQALAERLKETKLTALISSPLERAVETADAVAVHHSKLTVQIDPGVGEVDFGDWTGKKLRQLARKRLWKVVQGSPSRMRFPGGESFSEMQARVVSGLNHIADAYPNGTVAVFSHSDVLKAAFAHYAGVPLDLFQRITISPASITTVALYAQGVRLLNLNDTSHYSMKRQDHPQNS